MDRKTFVFGKHVYCQLCLENRCRVCAGACVTVCVCHCMLFLFVCVCCVLCVYCVCIVCVLCVYCVCIVCVLCVCVCVCVYVCMRTCVRAWVGGYMSVCTGFHVCEWTCMYLPQLLWTSKNLIQHKGLHGTCAENQ